MGAGTVQPSSVENIHPYPKVWIVPKLLGNFSELSLFAAVRSVSSHPLEEQEGTSGSSACIPHSGDSEPIRDDFSWHCLLTTGWRGCVSVHAVLPHPFPSGQSGHAACCVSGWQISAHDDASAKDLSSSG
jgi:hypothetical protein